MPKSPGRHRVAKSKRPKKPRGINLAEALYPALESGVDVFTRTIFFIGVVTEESVRRAVVALEMFDKSEGPVRIVLSSCGGEVDAGFTLYDTIRMSHNPVVIDCYGAVQSIAVLILQAATLRRMSPNCRMMVHQGTVGIEHIPTKSLRDISAEISLMNDRYTEILAERSGMSIKDMEALCSKESYMGPDQAIKLGLADLTLPVHNPMKFKISALKKGAKRKG